MNCYQTPTLALKLGHKLQKVCEIIHCTALMAEDEELIKSTETFKKLYSSKWSDFISHNALSTLNEAKFNKPLTLPFTHDVQLLHKHLETIADVSSEKLKQAPSPQLCQDCLRLYASQCGAQNPEHLKSTHLRKHVATLSQILNLKNNELDQVADFLGHDIHIHREYYRLPDATFQLAKISKLLLAMEKGRLPDIQGKSLDDIEIEDEINTDGSAGSESENGDEGENLEALEARVHQCRSGCGRIRHQKRTRLEQCSRAMLQQRLETLDRGHEHHGLNVRRWL
ncbi:uncharacterized protein LOC131343211 [Hemibagrus wyckioides]|uniref:uncharacterized protein LOC131343211 n=1 Tax=Hemibagrus wyckioides TaxID=337641 RepID=UPI00266C79B7|nr:uncharacterized protein LOC131343211 [Hemibagrus wyckioides]